MPLPRFTRLPLERRQHILDVARRHFARDGRDGASQNQILAEAGLSKASAYQYFDGKQDLAAEVLADVDVRLAAVLGPWEAAPDAQTFWARLDAASARLAAHLLAHPEDLAVVRELRRGDADQGGDRAWFESLIDDGRRLSLIRPELDRALLVAATVGFFRSVDGWALAQLASGKRLSARQVWSMLAGLWGTPEALAPRAGKGRRR